MNSKKSEENFFLIDSHSPYSLLLRKQAIMLNKVIRKKNAELYSQRVL